MCNKVIEEDLCTMRHGPNHFKTQEICNYPMQEDPSSLQYVPNWFVTQKQVDLWGDNDDYYDDDKLIEWYEGYQKLKAQKAKIKKNSYLLFGIHQDGEIEDEKGDVKKLWE